MDARNEIENQIARSKPNWTTEVLRETKTGRKLVALRLNLIEFGHLYSTDPTGYKLRQYSQNDTIASLLKTELLTNRYLSPKELLYKLLEYQKTTYRGAWSGTNQQALTFSTKLDNFVSDALELFNQALEELGELASGEQNVLQKENDELHDQIRAANALVRSKEVEIAGLRAERDALSEEVNSLRAKDSITNQQALKSENTELKARIRELESASKVQELRVADQKEAADDWRRQSMAVGRLTTLVRESLAPQPPKAAKQPATPYDQMLAKITQFAKSNLAGKVGAARAKAILLLAQFNLKTKLQPKAFVGNEAAFQAKLTASREFIKRCWVALMAKENESRPTSQILKELMADYKTNEVTPVCQHIVAELDSLIDGNDETLVPQTAQTRESAYKYCALMVGPETLKTNSDNEMYSVFKEAMKAKALSLSVLQPATTEATSQPAPTEVPAAYTGN